MPIWRHLKNWAWCILLAPFCLYGSKNDTVPAHYHLRHLVLAPSNAKVAAVKLSEGAPKIVVESLPQLGNKEFSDYINSYIGAEITGESINDLVNSVKRFLVDHGQALVNVSVPPQNVSDGEVRLVVVLGAYDLGRLIIAGSEDSARKAPVTPNSGQIVLADMPLLAQQSFAVKIAPFFGQPITDESLEGLTSAIEAFVKSQGQTVAQITLPPQDIRTGDLRIAVAIGQYPLRRLIIGSSPAALAKLHSGPSSSRIIAPETSYFQTPQFDRLMDPYFGRPIDKELSDQLRKDIAAYVTKQDRVVSAIPLPEINLASGEMRLVVGTEHYNQLKFKGNRWFSDQLLARQFGVKPGDEVRVSQVSAAINAINQNPYRHAQVLIDTVNKDPGVADLDIAVQEIAPYRITGSYDDTGNDTLGNNHYTLSAQFGNLFGLDHQLSVQYTTTDVNHAYHTAVLTYRAPLPWANHYISFTGAYAGYRTDYNEGFFHLKGSIYQGDLRYVIPVIHDNWSLEYSAGIDYKQNTLSVVAFGTQSVTDSAQDIAQATASITWLEHDKNGTSAFNASGNFSPGNLNHRNTDAAFSNTTIDPTTGQPVGAIQAQARYAYGNFFAQRLEYLPEDFQFLLRAQAQVSSARLVGTERFSIGGAATVRGYNERIESGDNGFVGTLELRGPALKTPIPFTGTRYVPVESRLLAFYDDGDTYYRHPNENTDFFQLSRLTSTGVGLRSNWASSFSISVDYGWQLRSTASHVPPDPGKPDPFLQPNRGRFHLQGSISY